VGILDAPGPGRFLDGLLEGFGSRALDLECVSRLWDVWVFEGDAVLVRGVVAVLGGLERRLLDCVTGGEVVRVLEGGLVGGGVGVDGGMSADAWMERVRDAGRISRGEREPPRSPMPPGLTPS
jgi:hypothetical protein